MFFSNKPASRAIPQISQIVLICFICLITPKGYVLFHEEFACVVALFDQVNAGL